jgi:hypothetical protein
LDLTDNNEIKAKGMFRISESGNANIPSEIRKELNKKELAYILNTKSAVIFSPDISYEELKRSLKYLIQTVDMRKGKSE